MVETLVDTQWAQGFLDVSCPVAYQESLAKEENSRKQLEERIKNIPSLLLAC